MVKQISLEAARALMGYTQKEAAEMFGVHYQTLAKWEEDSSSMKAKFIERIPAIYHVEKNSIFFGTKNEFTRYLVENEKIRLK